ncbi:MAG: alanine/ornithine racemase family PLP-dependent enzyme [Clostridiales bacterium]|nr:alanine/ornithine racemase family PLP-dependent enzyme [Clostridiales bacterium]
MNRIYPQLEIKITQIENNISEIVKLCKINEIEVTGVIKGYNGIPEISKTFTKNGCKNIGSSRIEQLKAMKEIDTSIETMMIRIPMYSELESIVKYADISLNSEMKVIEGINDFCKKYNKTHSVILMFDVGDIREGYFKDMEIVKAAKHIEESLKYIKLLGVGTNVGCYGSIRPTPKNMERLIEVAELVEDAIGRKLEIISGGATSSLTLVQENLMPKRINHLRIGEAIILNRDLEEFWGCKFNNMYNNNFVLTAEIIELKEKPSYPVGEIFIDAFGNITEYEDIGNRKKAILGIGRQDFGDHTKLIPIDENIKIIGSSSDHLIVDVTDVQNDIQIGDTLSFDLYYSAMLFASSSQYVAKKVTYGLK